MSIIYATLEDMESRYGRDALLLVAELPVDGEPEPEEPTEPVIDAVRVGEALDDARDEIDAYISTRYQIPLANVPPIVRRLACAMAMYYLSDTADVLTEEKRTRYTDAVKTLKLISEGKVKLGLPEAQVGKTAPAPEVIDGRGDFKGWGGL